MLTQKPHDYLLILFLTTLKGISAVFHTGCPLATRNALESRRLLPLQTSRPCSGSGGGSQICARLLHLVHAASVSGEVQQAPKRPVGHQQTGQKREQEEATGRICNQVR